MGIASRLETPPTSAFVSKNDPASRGDVTAPYRATRISQRGNLTTQRAVPLKAALPDVPNLAPLPSLSEAIAITPAIDTASIKLRQPSWLISAAIAATVGFLVWWVMFERLPDIDPRQVIATNLASAQRAFDDRHYVEPTERSALHYYSTVLALDPTNAAARGGIDRIADHYIQEARSRLGSGRIADAALAIERARRVRPEHPQLRSLDERMRAEMNQILAVARTPLSASPPQSTSAPTAAGAMVKEERGVAKEGRVAQKDTALRSMQDPPRSSAQAGRVIRLAQLDTSRRLIGEAQSNLGGQLLSDARAATGSNDFDGATRTLSQAREIGFTAGDVDAAEAALRSARASAPNPPATASPAQPKIIKLVKPEYPYDALMRGLEGWVDVSLLVAPSGNVLDQSIANSPRGRIFERAALSAVRQWKYEPHAGPEPQRLLVRVEFRLAK